MTREEEQIELIEKIYFLIDYWNNNKQTPKCKDKLEGLAFSILVTIDGMDADGKGYHLTPLNNNVDIAGGLHEIFNRQPK